MANHKSAKKRCRQALKRNEVNRSLLSKIKNNINIFHSLVSSKKVDEIQKSGFGSRDAVLLQELVAELEQLEQEDDELEAALRNDFFLDHILDIYFLYH